MHGHNKCGHHMVAKLLLVLAWLAALGFWLAMWKGMFWNVEPTGWFSHVVVFSLLAFGTKFCSCYSKNRMMGGMKCDCSCNDCEGGMCEGKHKEGHGM
ncbi:MAG: hypothetical protein WD898_00565 [Candidatus Paceibacterota bacterium]